MRPASMQRIMSWILSANRGGARIFENQGGELTLLEAITNEQGRLRDRDIDSDVQGRAFDRMTAGRHALSSSESPHERVAKAFARGLADRLRRGRLERRFERLVIAAEPHLLGLLRGALDTVTARMVVASVAKDLEQVPADELAAHLPELPHEVM
jgi:protein required for attachment to host cells